MPKYEQLVFNHNFNIESEIVIDFAHSFDELKDEYKEYINIVLNENILLHDVEGNLYCPNCLNIINNNHCTKCNKKYKNNKSISFYPEELISESKFLILDVTDDKDVIGYFINVESEYIDDYELYKVNNKYISKIVLIKEDGIIDLLNKEFYSFKMYDEILNDEEMKLLENDNYFKVFDFFEQYIDFIYLDNIDKLKETKYYKYSYIDKIKKDKDIYNVYELLCFPIYYKQSEYLNKMGLYDLANNNPYAIKNGKSFYESFGVSKKYFNYMKENNINYMTLLALKIYPTTDKELLEFIKELLFVFGYSELKYYIDNYIKIPKLYKYFKDNNINNYIEYYDYLYCVKELKLNLKDNKVLYPKDLIKEHNKLYKQVLILNDKDIDNKIKKVYKTLNKYEIDEYTIIPASNIDDLINESINMCNCVRIYAPKIANDTCQIYFMRYKKTPNKSLITIEVRNNKVVQARRKYNKDINDKERKVIDKFETKLHIEDN